jgi:hypothetical protein
MPSSKNYKPNNISFLGELIRGTPATRPTDSVDALNFDNARRQEEYEKKLAANPEFAKQIEQDDGRYGTLGVPPKVMSGTVDVDEMMTQAAGTAYNNINEAFGGGGKDKTIETVDKVKAAADGLPAISKYVAKPTAPISPFKMANTRLATKSLPLGRSKYGNAIQVGITAADAMDNAIGDGGVLSSLMTQRDAPGYSPTRMAAIAEQSRRY